VSWHAQGPAFALVHCQPRPCLRDHRHRLGNDRDRDQHHHLLRDQVDDCRTAVARAVALGGTVLQEAKDSPYGMMGHVADPAGAPIKLLTGPR